MTRRCGELVYSGQRDQGGFATWRSALAAPGSRGVALVIGAPVTLGAPGERGIH